MTPALLIADDSPQKTMLMEGMLLRHGWKGEIFTATTTEAAIALIDVHPQIRFGLIDFYIPSAHGPAVIEYLTKKHADARVALVSSSDNYENQEAAKAAGAEACICTSYEPEEVEMAFGNLLGDWISKK